MHFSGTGDERYEEENGAKFVMSLPKTLFLWMKK